MALVLRFPKFVLSDSSIFSSATDHEQSVTVTDWYLGVPRPLVYFNE